MTTKPDDAIDEKLYGLVEIAEQQQAAAHAILDQLSTERAALAQEREYWVDTMEKLRTEMAATVLESVSSSMSDVVANMAETISDLGKRAADQMAQLVSDTEQADQAFRKMTGWASARLLGWGLGVLAGLLLLGWLASGTVLWWDAKAIASAHVAKQQLQVEVAELRANGDAWIKAGLVTKLQRCGPKKRPCIAVDEAAGAYGEQSDYRMVKGS